MKLLKKSAFVRRVKEGRDICAEFERKKEKLDQEMERMGVAKCGVYLQEIEGSYYLFHFFESEEEPDFPDEPARQVYEFRLHEGDDLSGLESKGIIIGVAPGKLDEYIRLHDEQPQIIHDLCYQNGFRKSSIFVFQAASGNDYLLQFQEFKGEENPKLYENPVYQEWLRVTGECQKPLPGETFWKEMKNLYNYNR